ncbi:MAG: hypothetical protein R3A47_01460 [Polyangiales bacterium]
MYESDESGQDERADRILCDYRHSRRGVAFRCDDDGSKKPARLENLLADLLLVEEQDLSKSVSDRIADFSKDRFSIDDAAASFLADPPMKKRLPNSSRS